MANLSLPSGDAAARALTRSAQACAAQPRKTLDMANLSLPSGDAAARALTRSAQACAACKYQRKKCSPDCTLARYFPADKPDLFHAAHDLFGVGNILKTIRGLNQTQLSTAMSSILYQSWMRKQDPIRGCCTTIYQMQTQLHAASVRRDALRRQRDKLRAQVQAMSEPLQGDHAALPNPIPDDPPPPPRSPQQQIYRDDFCAVKSSRVAEVPEEEINPPPSSSALPPAASDLPQDLPHHQIGEAGQDKLNADMLQQIRHDLEQDENDVFSIPPTHLDLWQDLLHPQSGEGDHDKLMADRLQPANDNPEEDPIDVSAFLVDPLPSPTPPSPTSMDLSQDLPQPENGVGDEDKLPADTLQPMQHHQPAPLMDPMGPEEDLDDMFKLDFSDVYLPPADDDILSYLTTPEYSSPEEELTRPQ